MITIEGFLAVSGARAAYAYTVAEGGLSATQKAELEDTMTDGCDEAGFPVTVTRPDGTLVRGFFWAQKSAFVEAGLVSLPVPEEPPAAPKARRVRAEKPPAPLKAPRVAKGPTAPIQVKVPLAERARYDALCAELGRTHAGWLAALVTAAMAAAETGLTPDALARVEARTAQELARLRALAERGAPASEPAPADAPADAPAEDTPEPSPMEEPPADAPASPPPMEEPPATPAAEPPPGPEAPMEAPTDATPPALLPPSETPTLDETAAPKVASKKGASKVAPKKETPKAASKSKK